MKNMRTAQNPYIVGGPIKEPRDFFGRQQELRQTFERISTAQSTELVGDRRSGLTSMLYQISNHDVHARYGLDSTELLFVHVDCQSGVATPHEFFRQAFVHIAPESLGALLRSDDPHDYRGIVREVLTELYPRKVVLLLDEFDYVVKSEAFSIDFFNLMRSLSMTHDLCMIVATRERLYKTSPADKVGSPFFNIFFTIYLGSFRHMEFADFVEETSARSGVSLEPYWEHLLDLGGRFPYLLQMACWHYFEWLRDRDQPLSPLDHESIRHSFARQARAHFEYVWEDLDRDEQETVLALATPHLPFDNVTMHRLSRKGYVIEDRLFSSAFREFILDLSKGMWIDEATGEVHVEGRFVDYLRPSEYDLLRFLYRNRGRICTKDEIAIAVFGEDYLGGVDDQRIAKLVSRLRLKVEPDPDNPQYIVSVRRRGYKLMREKNVRGKVGKGWKADADTKHERHAASSVLQSKIEADFDVFLCHNSEDKPAVKAIGERLKKEGVLPWLDEWELQPGLPWQRLLEEQIAQIRSAAVFVGKEGIGPWQQLELEAFLREFVNRGCPVIPVLLSDSPKKPKLPIFLRGMTWVDFRKDDPDPMEQLIWGITGKRGWT